MCDQLGLAFLPWSPLGGARGRGQARRAAPRVRRGGRTARRAPRSRWRSPGCWAVGPGDPDPRREPAGVDPQLGRGRWTWCCPTPTAQPSTMPEPVAGPVRRRRSARPVRRQPRAADRLRRRATRCPASGRRASTCTSRSAWSTAVRTAPWSRRWRASAPGCGSATRARSSACPTRPTSTAAYATGRCTRGPRRCTGAARSRSGSVETHDDEGRLVARGQVRLQNLARGVPDRAAAALPGTVPATCPQR